MKKITFWKSLFLLFALIVGSSSAWADEEVYYTLSTTTTGSNNSYAGNCDITVGKSPKAITWNVTGNAQMSPWRIGGKKLTSATNRKVYSKTAMNENITKVVFAFGSSSSTFDDQITVNSVKLTISTENNGGGTVIDEVTKTSGFGASQTLTFTPSENKEWSVGSYYTFTFNITTDNVNSNRYFEFGSAVFYYEEASATPSSDANFTNKTPSINYPAVKTYSQVPTTATGYTGAITYSMTANTAGATINESTGEVTVTTGGSVTVKATAAAVPGSFSSSEDSYTLTVNDTRISADLSWSAASADVTYGADNNIFPTLTNTHSVPVTYESTNTKAATINGSTGEITLQDFTGTTAIKAIFAGNDDYLPQTVTYTLNVSKAPFSLKDGVFDFVEAAEQYPLVNYGSGVSPTSSSSDYIEADKTWTAGNVQMVTSGKYRWWSGTNGCDLRFYSNTPNSSATFSVPDGYVITKIVTTSQNFVSANTGTLNGSTWTGASQSVKLSIGSSTVTIKTITVTYTTANQTFTPAKTYTTLTSAYALNFTDVSGLKAYIATEIADSKVQMVQVNKVPANTGLVLKATTPGSAVDVPVFDGTGADDVSGNKMAGSATSTTAIDANGGYILKNGVFQPANAGTLAAGKAYLAITVTSARALEMSFEDTTTGINGVEEIAPATKTRKVVKNGRLVIETANGEFTVSGARVK